MNIDITEEKLQAIGFDFVKEYPHDQFVTRRFQKGYLEVEISYEDGAIVSANLTIEEINCLEISFEKLQILSNVLGDNW